MSSKSTLELVSLFKQLREKAVKSGVSIDAIKSEFKRDVQSQSKKSISKTILFIVFFVVPLVLGFGGYFSTKYLMDLWQEDLCIVNVNEIFNEIARKPTNCSLMCEEQKEVPRLSGLNKQSFIENYAYNGRPLVVTDAASNWSALDVFNYTFFKELYDSNNGSYETNEDECQFFPYKTNFTSLREAFNMTKERSELNTEPWYFGWSNCDPVVREKLREHYQLPYFLPSDSETSQQDWLFMGGPGLGAQIHIDSVERPSWQAQLSGRKVWTLIPPPECEHVCSTLKVQVNKGEVILVDTNQWFHKTEVLQGDISITIGAEYD